LGNGSVRKAHPSPKVTMSRIWTSPLRSSPTVCASCCLMEVKNEHERSFGALLDFISRERSSRISFICQRGSQTLAHRSYLSRVTTRRIWPFSNPGTPMSMRGSRISWEKVQVQVGDMISKDEEIHMLCSLTGFECPAQASHKQAEGLSFLVRLLR